VNAVARSLTTLDTVEAFAAAAERFAVAAAWSDLRAPVASCPGWSTYDLVAHLGNIHAWAATIVETGQRAAEQNDEPRSATKGKVVSSWYVGKAEDLYEVLRHTPLDKPCWNFAHGQGPASFWARRQLHETLMHQVDLDGTQGRSTALDPDVCVDGVDEVLDAMLARMHRRGHVAALTRPVALTADDTGDTWVVAPQGRHATPRALPAQGAGPAGRDAGPPPSVQHRRAGGTAVPDRVEARADVLYRLLWHRRVADEDVRVLGDQARVRAFLDSRLTP
jgi:uncharacterized protein (TIGR03083 family)